MKIGGGRGGWAAGKVGSGACVASRGRDEGIFIELEGIFIEQGVQRGLKMKDLRDLKDLTIHDAQPIGDE